MRAAISRADDPQPRADAPRVSFVASSRCASAAQQARALGAGVAQPAARRHGCAGDVLARCVRSRTLREPRQRGQRRRRGGASGRAARTCRRSPLGADDGRGGDEAAERVGDAQDAGRDAVDLARAGGERQRGGALDLAVAAAVRARAGRARAGGGASVRRPSGARRRGGRRRIAALAPPARRSRRRRCGADGAPALPPLGARAAAAGAVVAAPSPARRRSRRRAARRRRAERGSGDARPRAPRRARGAAARGKPAPTRGVELAGEGGPGARRSSRSATASSPSSARSGSTRRPASAASSAASSRTTQGSVRRVIDGLPELGHGAVQQGAGVGDADAEHGGDLGVVEPGVELERDQLALARRPARRARRARRRARSGALGGVLGRRRAGVGRARPRARRCACAGAARRARRCGRCRTATRAACRGAASKRARLAVGALERLGGDVLGAPRGRAAASRRRRRRRRARRGRARRSRAPPAWRFGGGSVAVSVLVTSVLRRARRSITDSAALPFFGACAAARAACLALGCALLGRPPAPSARRGADRLWATVNVCDTAKHPNAIGIRALDAGHAARRAAVDALPRAVPRRRRTLALTSTDADSGWRKRRRAGGRAIESGWSFDVRRRRRSRSRCAASCASAGARPAASCAARPRSHRGRATAPPPARTRPATPPPAARSPERASTSNSRGSFVMTPVTPSASSRRIRARVVDRPHVELAARAAGRPRTSARRDEPPVRHHARRSGPRAMCAAAARRQPPAHVGSERVAPGSCVQRRARVVAPQRAAPTSRAAAAGSSSRSDDQAAHRTCVEMSVRSTSPCARSASTTRSS